MSVKSITSGAITAVGAVALAGAAFATPGSSAVGTVMARAAFTDRVDFGFRFRHDGKTQAVNVVRTNDTVLQQIVFGPGGLTGWHSHPGPAIALIKSGELTLYSGDDPNCEGHPYGVGQSFIDPGQGRVHMGRNLTNQTTEVWVTYLDVPPGQSVRLDAPDPGNCPF
jgi:quercetin dioxygenase-like cupin family protein